MTFFNETNPGMALCAMAYLIIISALALWQGSPKAPWYASAALYGFAAITVLGYFGLVFATGGAGLEFVNN
jgi:hypothetical protein